MEGTLWSGSLFSFTSPIDTLLDKEGLTIEELLGEDELLQEIKSNNTRLINKLTEEQSVEGIVRYMSEPAPEGADDVRVHKYPYMACEVLCCEVNSLIDLVVDGRQGAFMDQLFTVITRPEPASDRLAGYFEKVLNVVFRRKSVDVMAYLDRKGISLFQAFCRQLHSYSVMQSLRILLLPAVQLAREDSGVFVDEDETPDANALATSLQCAWHRDEAALNHLITHLTAGSADARAHASELLISVIDLSPRSSMFHSALIGASTLHILADSAVPPLKDAASMESSAPTAALDADSELAGGMVAALSVLEVAVVQFCDESALQLVQQAALELEAAAAAAGSGESTDAPTAVATPAPLPSTAVPDDAAEVLCGVVPRVAAYLRSHVSDTRTVPSPKKNKPPEAEENVPRLGLVRLKLVNLVEALLRLGLPKMDHALVEAGMLGLLLELFFKYQWHTLLHQSVMASVMLVVEGAKAPLTATASPPVSADAASHAAPSSREGLQRHLVVDARLLERVMKALNDQLASEKARGVGSGAVALRRPGFFGHAVVMCESVMKGIVGGGFIADLVSTAPAGPAWHDFMLGTLSEITAVQCRPIGGYAYPNRHEGMSGTQGDSSFGQSGDDDDEKLDDEALAEQISRLGLDSGYGSGYGGGGDDDSDDEEENAIAAAALAAAYGLGSGLGSRHPDADGLDNSSSGGTPTGGTVGIGEEDSDDEEEDAALAAALAQAYGGKGTGVGMPAPATSDFGGADPFASDEGGGGFADFDSFASPSDPSEIPSSSPSSSAFGPTDSSPQSEVDQNGVAGGTEADDFANWGDFSSPEAKTDTQNGGVFADFADFGGGAAPRAEAPSSTPASPTVAEAGSPSRADLSPASPESSVSGPAPSPPPAASKEEAPGAGVSAASAAAQAGLGGGNPLFQASFEGNTSDVADSPTPTPTPVPAVVPDDPFSGATPFVAHFAVTPPQAATADSTSSQASDPFGGFDAFSTSSTEQQKADQGGKSDSTAGIDAFAAFK